MAMARQFRLVHIGVSALLAAATVTSIGLIREVSAGGPGTPSSFVPISPCRLADTRAGADQIGPRATPIGSGEDVGFAVWGTNGNCTIPSTATGIAGNVTAVGATASSYLTVYPSDATRPTASNLNYTPASPPTPNQVTVALSATGSISAFNLTGSVDIIIDIVGYYLPAATGPVGPVSVTEYYTGQSAVQSSGGTLIYTGTNGCVELSYQLPYPSVFVNLVLPLGAKITKVTIRYRDLNPGSYASASFYLNSVASPISQFSQVSTIAHSANVGDSLDLQLSPTIPTVGPSAVFYVEANANTYSGQQLCGVAVTYTV